MTYGVGYVGHESTAVLRCCLHLNLLQQMNDLRRSDIAKDTVKTFVMDIGKVGFLQQGGVHSTILGQVGGSIPLLLPHESTIHADLARADT